MDGAKQTTFKKHPAAAQKRAQAPNTVTRFFGEVDRPFLIIVVLLVSIGSVTIFSSSYAYAEHRWHDSYYLAKPQLGYALAGILIMAVIAFFARPVLATVKKMVWPLYFAALGLNFLVPLIGVSKNGAKRWLALGGLQFQPSEILKIALVLLLADYIVKNRDRLYKPRYGLFGFGLIAAPALFATLLQSHLSATIINLLIVFFMMWLGGSSAKLLGWVTGLVGAVAVAVLSFGKPIIEAFVPHALTRLEIWRDPFSFMSVESGGKGWQPAQSLYAISSGGFWGVGLGQSNQKHGYLPEPYNDYIFAILCEEMGFFGAVLIIALFAAFAFRGFHIANRSQDKFSSLMVMGIIVHVIIQVLLNLAVVSNSIPSTGISLPFFSYGGTSLLILMAEMGLVLAVSRYSYTEKG